MTLIRLFAGLLLSTATLMFLTPLAAQERGFDAWLAELRQEALDRGISAESVALAFSEITPPVQRIISSDRSQPERVQTYADYIGARVSDWKIENGRKRMIGHADLLREVGEKYGVQPRFIVAFWGMETNFGTYPIPEPLFNVLATLSFDNRRASFFRPSSLPRWRCWRAAFLPTSR